MAFEVSGADISSWASSFSDLAGNFLQFGAAINATNHLPVSSANGDPVTIVVPGITPDPNTGGSNTLMYVGIGLGVLLLLALIFIVALRK